MPRPRKHGRPRVGVGDLASVMPTVSADDRPKPPVVVAAQSQPAKVSYDPSPSSHAPSHVSTPPTSSLSGGPGARAAMKGAVSSRGSRGRDRPPRSGDVSSAGPLPRAGARNATYQRNTSYARAAGGASMQPTVSGAVVPTADVTFRVYTPEAPVGRPAARHHADGPGGSGPAVAPGSGATAVDFPDWFEPAQPRAPSADSLFDDAPIDPEFSPSHGAQQPAAMMFERAESARSARSTSPSSVGGSAPGSRGAHYGRRSSRSRPSSGEPGHDGIEAPSRGKGGSYASNTLHGGGGAAPGRPSAENKPSNAQTGSTKATGTSRGRHRDAEHSRNPSRSRSPRRGPRPSGDPSVASGAPHDGAPGFREMSYQWVGMDRPTPEVAGARGPTGASAPVDNEGRVRSDSDRLVYSKKARPVQYKPKTLADYKRQAPKEYVELGSLGADLDSEELVAKRANQARVKMFSEQLRKLNRKDAGGDPPKNPKRRPKRPDGGDSAGGDPPTSPRMPKPAPVPERERARAQRERALQFAKQVPKPKVRPRKHDEAGPSVAFGSRVPAPSASEDLSPRGPSSPLRGGHLSDGISAVDCLEAEHDRLRAHADSIRREMGL